MSDDSQLPWSDNPNAPLIPYSLYSAEKDNLAGIFITSIFYGIVLVLFFKCMVALIVPLNLPRGSRKWGLIVHTITMFSCVTVYTGMTLAVQSVSDIDSREFPGDGPVPPGPVGYQVIIYSKALGIVPSAMFLMNQWLADGLLLYRCYVIYSSSYWVITLPSLMYIVTWAMGIVFLYQTSQPGSIRDSLAANTGIPYNSISLALNVLLTLMIVMRLVLHSRNLRKAIGSSDTATGLYSSIIATLVESSALFTVNSLLFIVPWGAGSWVAAIFLPILAETQVISPLLIILRVANRKAVASQVIVTGNVDSSGFYARGRSTSGTVTFPDASPTDSMGANGEILDGIGTGVGPTVKELRSGGAQGTFGG